MRSAMANSQNRPAAISATPTAAEPKSLTRPIWGSWAVVSRSASFSIAVLSSSIASTKRTAATSSTLRIVVTPISHANGSASRSATSSSRMACSERTAKARPLRELMEAFQNRSNSESRCRRHRLGLAGMLLLEQLRDQESQVERLLGIKPEIADRVVAVVEILVGDGARTADAFGHVLAGHFQMDAAGMGALDRMDRKEAFDLGEDAVERTGLVARGRGDGVAMHRIARPHHHAAFALHRADQARQMVADLVGAETVDQRQPSRLVVRVEHVDQPQQLVRFQRGTAFQADRILDAAEIFHMGVIELPRAVAD